jgi:hypothetical protein
VTSKSSVIRPSTRVRSAAICLSFFLLCRQAGPLNSKRLRLFENATGGKWGTLFFWGRKYGDYNLSSHGNQRIQADAWGVNPGVGWYVTTPNPFSPNGRQIQAAGPIYNTEGEAKPASTQSSWMARIRRPLRHPVHRLALLISLERYATSLPFFSLWPQRGADGAAPSKGYLRLELASCRLSRPSGGRNS